MRDPHRTRIDEVRRKLLDSFMSEDMETYAQCVFELEDLIGVPHGDRNHAANGANAANAKRSAQKHKDVSKVMLQARYGKRSLQAETVDGITTWSVDLRNENAGEVAATAEGRNQSR